MSKKMSRFSDLKKSSGNFSALTKELEALASGEGEKQSYQDERFWRAQVDSAGNGTALIRFLPEAGEETIPFVKYWSHGFKGPSGLWYIENCRTSIKKSDPVADSNNELWETGIEANKNIARDRKRRLHYVSNILVLKDPANPENEGEVFLFKYGKKIHDMIKGKMFPDFDDEEAINPFDLWVGCDFKLRIRKVDGYTNYDKSEFSHPAPLFNGDDDAIEDVWKKEHLLQPFIDPENFKSYDDLKEKLDRVLGVGEVKERVTAEDVEPDEEDVPMGDSELGAVAGAVAVDEEVDDSMEMFRKLAEED